MMTKPKQRVTAIVRFDHSAIIVGGLGKRQEFPSFKALSAYVEAQGAEIGILHAHPAGVSIKSEPHREDTAVPVLRSISRG